MFGILPDSTTRRREFVFVLIAGLFLGSLTMLNILGISRFIKLHETGGGFIFSVAIGVLPYPVTFLCTDLISELYGRWRAQLVVWTGLFLNMWVVFILWIGGVLPGFETVSAETGQPLLDAAGRLPVFYEVRELAFGAVVASMVAYLVAQTIDVMVFHKLKDLTKGKKLWLRNNLSTLFSQFADTTCVILLTYYATDGLARVVNEENPVLPQLALLIGTGYAFKALVALLDTIPFYYLVKFLRKYLNFPE